MGAFDLGPGHCHKKVIEVKCVLKRNSEMFQ
jgi:hypothetical protein